MSRLLALLLISAPALATSPVPESRVVQLIAQGAIEIQSPVPLAGTEAFSRALPAAVLAAFDAELGVFFGNCLGQPTPVSALAFLADHFGLEFESAAKTTAVVVIKEAQSNHPGIRWRGRYLNPAQEERWMQARVGDTAVLFKSPTLWREAFTAVTGYPQLVGVSQHILQSDRSVALTLVHEIRHALDANAILPVAETAAPRMDFDSLMSDPEFERYTAFLALRFGKDPTPQERMSWVESLRESYVRISDDLESLYFEAGEARAYGEEARYARQTLQMSFAEFLDFETAGAYVFLGDADTAAYPEPEWIGEDQLRPMPLAPTRLLEFFKDLYQKADPSPLTPAPPAR